MSKESVKNTKDLQKLYGGVDDLLLPNKPVGVDGKILKNANEIDNDYHEKLDRVKAYVSKNSSKLSNDVIVSSFNRLNDSVQTVLNLKTRRLKSGKYKNMLWKNREAAEPVTFLRDYTDVLMMQVLLKKMGYSVNLSSKFDAKTVSVLKAFQKDVGIKVDGEFGPKTLSKMKFVLQKYVGVDLSVDEKNAYDFEFDSTTGKKYVDGKLVKNYSVNEYNSSDVESIVNDLEKSGEKFKFSEKNDKVDSLADKPVHAISLGNNEFVIYAGDGKKVGQKKFGFKLPSSLGNPDVKLGGEGVNTVDVKILEGDRNNLDYKSKFVAVSNFKIVFDKFGGEPVIKFPKFKTPNYKVRLRKRAGGGVFEITDK